jgi:hypothetical protein
MRMHDGLAARWNGDFQHPNTRVLENDLVVPTGDLHGILSEDGYRQEQHERRRREYAVHLHAGLQGFAKLAVVEDEGVCALAEPESNPGCGVRGRDATQSVVRRNPIGFEAKAASSSIGASQTHLHPGIVRILDSGRTEIA